MIDKIKRKKNMFKTFLFSSLLLLPTTGVFSAADGDGSGVVGGIATFIYNAVENILMAGIRLVQSIILGLCSFCLKFINSATGVGTGENQDLYKAVTSAFQPFFWFSKNYLVPISIGILSLGLVWGLMKSLMSGSSGSKDDPIKLVARTLIAGVVIFITPQLITGMLGSEISPSQAGVVVEKNKSEHTYNAKTNAKDGIIPVFISGISDFSVTNSSNSTNTTFGLNIGNIAPSGEGDKFSPANYKDKNNEILTNGAVTYFGADKSTVEDALGADISNETAGETASKKISALNDDGKDVISKISNSMYSSYASDDITSDIIWKLLYLIVFAIMPGMIVYNLVMILYVYIKRLVALILSTCIAPLAIAFAPGASTSEVTTKWIKSVIGYSLMAMLTLAFTKLGVTVYITVLNFEYGDSADLLLVIVLQLACIAILGYIREMETFVNNLGGNLMQMKPAITGTLGKIVSGWGEKGVLVGARPMTKFYTGIGSDVVKGLKGGGIGFVHGLTGTKEKGGFGGTAGDKLRTKIGGAQTSKATARDDSPFKNLKKGDDVSPELLTTGNKPNIPTRQNGITQLDSPNIKNPSSDEFKADRSEWYKNNAEALNSTPENFDMIGKDKDNNWVDMAAGKFNTSNLGALNTDSGEYDGTALIGDDKQAISNVMPKVSLNANPDVRDSFISSQDTSSAFINSNDINTSTMISDGKGGFKYSAENGDGWRHAKLVTNSRDINRVQEMDDAKRQEEGYGIFKNSVFKISETRAPRKANL